MAVSLETKTTSLPVEDIPSRPDDSQQIMTGPIAATAKRVTNSTSGIFTAFTKFLEFPIEIRRMVWNHALATPCVIRARDQWFRYPTNIRHVCHEAREEALKVQILYSVSPDPSVEPLALRLYTTFVNPSIDTILMDPDCLWPDCLVQLPHQRRIKTLAFSLSDWQDLILWMNDWLDHSPLVDPFDTMQGHWHRLPLVLWDLGVEEITLLVNRRSDWMQASYPINFVEPVSGWVTVDTARSLGIDVGYLIIKDMWWQTAAYINSEVFTWEEMEYIVKERYKAVQKNAAIRMKRDNPSSHSKVNAGMQLDSPQEVKY